MAARGSTGHFNFEDPLMEQSLYQEVFERCFCKYFESKIDVQVAEEAYQCTMSSDELNIIRYVAGYVVKIMLRKFKKKPDDPSFWIV